MFFHFLLGASILSSDLSMSSAPGSRVQHSLSLSESVIKDISAWTSVSRQRSDYKNASNEQIRKLSVYGDGFGLHAPDSLMVFVGMPDSPESARDIASEMAQSAEEFAQYGFTPIFIFEPTTENGQLDFGDIKGGKYEQYLDTLFSLLRNDFHLDEKKLGLLVPYPEINTPAFNKDNFVPSDFGGLVNRFFSTAKKYFPKVRGGILLDSRSYASDEWSDGAYVSLAPYIRGIDHAHIQTFGIQGFPWVDADGGGKDYNPNVFLPMRLIDESRRMLGTKSVWINTGTIAKKYRIHTISSSVSERKRALELTLILGRRLRSMGLDTMIHIFGEDKLDTDEETDWSYATPEERTLLLQFIKKSHISGINVGFFDK